MSSRAEEHEEQPPVVAEEEEKVEGGEEGEEEKVEDEGKPAAEATTPAEYKFHDFVVESLPFRSTTEYKKRSQITKLKYAEYEHEWPDMPGEEGDWIGYINNVIQKELVMIGKVVAVIRKVPPPPKQDTPTPKKLKSRKRKKSEESDSDAEKLSDIEFEVQVVVLSPYGFTSNDAENDPRWKPIAASGKTTIQVPFSARVCRVRHDPDGSFRRSRW